MSNERLKALEDIMAMMAVKATQQELLDYLIAEHAAIAAPQAQPAPVQEPTLWPKHNKDMEAELMRMQGRELKLLFALAEKPEQQQEPVATVAEVHMSRYTIEWTNGPLPEGTELYTSPPAQRKPLTNTEFCEQWFKQTGRIMGTDKLLLLQAKRVTEAAHGIKEQP